MNKIKDYDGVCEYCSECGDCIIIDDKWSCLECTYDRVDNDAEKIKELTDRAKKAEDRITVLEDAIERICLVQPEDVARAIDKYKDEGSLAMANAAIDVFALAVTPPESRELSDLQFVSSTGWKWYQDGKDDDAYMMENLTDYDPNEDHDCMQCGGDLPGRFLFCSKECRDALENCMEADNED